MTGLRPDTDADWLIDRHASERATRRAHKLLAAQQAYARSGKQVDRVAAIQAGPLAAEPVDRYAFLSTSRQGCDGDHGEDLGCDSDPINHPTHYADGWSNGAEVIDITENLNFNRGNAVKYLARAGAKDPAREVEDLRKAAWYVAREIARLESR